MPLICENGKGSNWEIRKIGVAGPGIVGMPMAALLADAHICEGTDRPASVLVVQRDSSTSGWKVDAINSGRSPIGGIEPDLDMIVQRSVKAGLLGATHDYEGLSDADVILVCVQTDKDGLKPDYGPLLDSLGRIAKVLQFKPSENIPLIVIESTLAPSTMFTIVRDLFAKYDLIEGRDILLGNSPNRVMPGRLVERVASSDKLVGGLLPLTADLIQRLYSRIVTRGRLFPTNSMTAEVVKTLENAYRDVRIAYAAEIVRYCDAQNVDFFQLRDEVNKRLGQADDASKNSSSVPTGGLLIPTVGVGGHCLPKDGILLRWRLLENEVDSSKSLILGSRRVNDASPSYTLQFAESLFGPLAGRPVTILGAAYRGDSEDTRNSPSLVLARLLLDKGVRLKIHDPYVRYVDQNLLRTGLQGYFTQDLGEALSSAEVIVAAAPHRFYADLGHRIVGMTPGLSGIFDACNLWPREVFANEKVIYGGIGRGAGDPDRDLVDCVVKGFNAMERGFALEVGEIIDFLNERYVDAPHNRVEFNKVQMMAGSCSTGCNLADPVQPDQVTPYKGFLPFLVRLALGDTCEGRELNCPCR
jgi:UDP-N-acetyl-D-mannosaminuronic acid dehydrogenase